MARRVLASVAELRSAVAVDGELSGDLRIGVSSFMSDAALAKSFAPLRQTHPKIALFVSHALSAELTAKLDEGALDAAIVCLPAETQPPQDFVRLPIGRFPVLFVASRELNVARRPSLKELSAYPWIVSQDGCGMRRTVRRAFESRGLTFKLGVEAISPEFRMTLVAAGLGIGITCAPWLANSAARESLQVIDVPEFTSEICVWLVHRLPPGRLTSALTVLQQSLEYACALSGKKLGAVSSRRVSAAR
jgi:DNA-binding transcriptional LysR family regulator